MSAPALIGSVPRVGGWIAAHAVEDRHEAHYLGRVTAVGRRDVFFVRRDGRYGTASYRRCYPCPYVEDPH